jgi:phosphohistidine swiveling domain-containing protein
MTQKPVIALNDQKADLNTVGGKGASLSRLINASFPVPDGFHVTTSAYQQFVAANKLGSLIAEALRAVDMEKPSSLEEVSRRIREAFMQAEIPDEISSAIVGAYGDLKGSDPAVAVRSSATAEDLPTASFAGQQESFLNVSGAHRILEAVKKCWGSLWTSRAIGYRFHQGIDQDTVALAVVIQQLVDAEVAGILFTVNPKDGNRKQMQISSAWGLGDAIVGGRVNSDDFIISKETQEVVNEEIGQKEIMTVRTDSTTEDQPVPENLQGVPSLQQADLKELARYGLKIEDLYEMPMDIEWALADGKIWILQARPITGLPEVYIPSPEDWEPPQQGGRYMRASIVDMMPDPLSPLFATLGTSIYNQAIYDMMVDLSGKQAAFPKDVIVPLYDYAYMRVNFSGREWWAMLVQLFPGIIKGIRKGPDHFRNVALPEYQERVDLLSQPPVREMTADQIWRDSHELVRAAMDHLSILQVDTLGAAAGSEGLFTALYNRFMKREQDPLAPAFVMGFDNIPSQSEKSLYDLAQWVSGQPELAAFLIDTSKEAIRKLLGEFEMPVGVPANVWEEFRRHLYSHLERFGYILFDLDFAKAVPCEDPGPELGTIKMYLRGKGSDPYKRHAELKERRIRATEELLERARGLRGWAVRKALGWAQSVGEVREDSIASIGLAYPRLRALLKGLGHRMVAAGAIENPDDIFWLEESEIETLLPALGTSSHLPNMRDRINKRRKLCQAEARVLPPTQIPPSDKYMGIPVEAFVPGEGGVEEDRLKGVGASAGKASGPACVLHGPEDFDRMEPGGILVAKLTTPAWTPLFAMASAIVTDIGGPLSHGSIVAREYGIPAVLGTGAATRMIEYGQEITVDGDAGYVILTSES